MAKNRFGLKNVNKALWRLFLLALLYCIYNLAVFIIPGTDTQQLNPAPVKAEKPVEPKPLDYYLQDVDRKNLFKAAEGSSSVSGAAKSGLAELAQTFVLKGIIEGLTLQAAIEDTKSGKTYFVVKNDTIGDIIVEDITANKVKLRHDGETMDLTL